MDEIRLKGVSLVCNMYWAFDNVDCCCSMTQVFNDF